MSTAIVPSLPPRSSAGNINVSRGTLVNPRHMHHDNPIQNILKTPPTSSHHEPCARTLSCNWQIINCNSIEQENMNFMLSVLQESFPSDVCVQPARLLDVQFPSFNLKNGSKRFIAPILDAADQGQWSLVHATYQDEDWQQRIPRHVTVQYYDPCYSQGRSKAVKEKLNSWIERDHGEDMGLRFVEAKGPVDPESPDMSGMHIIMAACEFARFAMVKSKSKYWDRDPKTFLEASLQQQTHNSPPCQTNTIEPDSNESMRLASPSSDQQQEQQSPHPSISLSTASTTPPTSPVAGQSSKTHAISPEADDSLSESCSEPNSKRRRVEDKHSPLFNFTGKMKEAARSFRDDGLPGVYVLQRERENCYDELFGKRQALRKMEEVLGICDTQYTLRKQEYGHCDQECKATQADITKAEKAINSFLSKLPSLSSLEIEVDVTDMDLVQAMSTTLEVNMVNPLRDKFRDKLNRKRKVGQMLESMRKVCIERQNDVDKFKEEEKLIEEQSREACQREEFAAMLESFAKKSLAFNQAWETIEGKECRNWYEAFCERRAQA
ncbi:hypothetical protein FHETE_7357 [Fusarium heterosporum]|uniref:Uncharacterized protein n=1 Tax=Fusarium heterosporum TaxID=42747 RepID=A0A8H5T7L2_FUSHE|nr:hypothetical protein FHETE_7357 [Fusarium heterosporum]